MSPTSKPYEAKGTGHRSPSRKPLKRSDNLIFLLCIGIAAFFWLLIKLSGTYTVSYDYRVKYTHVPAEKRLTQIIDTTININFSARGYDILKLNLTEDADVLTIDLRDYMIRKLNGDEYFIQTDLIKEELASFINVNESDIMLSHNKLRFVLSDLHRKEVEVKTRESIQFKDPFELYEEEQIEPARIAVFGPSSILDTLQNVYTNEINLTDIDEDQIVTIPLMNPFPDLLNFKPEEVTVRLRVERFTESFVEKEIDLTGISRNIRTFPSTVRVHFKVAQKDFSNVNAAQFRVVPELANIDLEEAQRLHLKLIETPDFTRDEWIAPADVEFLIIKE